MKKAVLALGIVALIGFSSVAEASQFSSGLAKTWGYATAPVNCLAALGMDLLGAGSKFVMCFLSNMNPGNLIP